MINAEGNHGEDVKEIYGMPDAGHFNDAFHDYVVYDDYHAAHRRQTGTKAATHDVYTALVYGQLAVKVRLVKSRNRRPFADFDAVMQLRRDEADAFYAYLQCDLRDDEARLIQRQALAGMIWGKQFYCYEIPQWL